MAKRILFVDDEPVYVKYYVLELQSAGFEVQMMVSASDALERISELSFDVVILDIMMAPPERYRQTGNRAGLETGIFLLQDMLAAMPDRKVVVLTNVSNSKTLDKCRLAPHFVPVFEKPECSPRRFVKEIKHLV